MATTEKTSTEQGQDTARPKSDEPFLVRITPSVTIAIAAFGLPGPIDGLIRFYGNQVELPDATLKVAAGAAAGFLAVAALGRYELTRRQNHYTKEQTNYAKEQSVPLVLKRLAGLAGSDPATVSGHSLRRGFATEARRNGADLIAVCRHGRWTDGSRAVMGYFADVDRWNDSPLNGIGL